MCFKVSSANLRPFCLGLNVLNYALFTSLPEIRYHCLGFRLTLQWCHNGRDGVSNHRRLESILNRLFRRISKKTSKFRVTGFCEGIHRWPVNSPHEGLVTRKKIPFDDVIMELSSLYTTLDTDVSILRFVYQSYIDWELMIILFQRIKLSGEIASQCGNSSVRYEHPDQTW